MRHGRVVAMLIAVCAAGPASAVREQAISYAEPHEPGSDVPLTQGIWDCSAMRPAAAARTMADMARHPKGQEALGRAAGCTRTVDPDRIEAPWRVVRRIATLCEERSSEDGEIMLPGGRRRTRSYLVCGREAHALVVRRANVTRTVIDVIDLQSYD